MEGAVPLKLYIYDFTRRRKGWSPGNLLIPSKRPTDLYSSFSPCLTKPSEGASGHPVRMPFLQEQPLNQEPSVCWESRVHPSSSNEVHLIREVTTERTRGAQELQQLFQASVWPFPCRASKKGPLGCTKGQPSPSTPSSPSHFLFHHHSSLAYPICALYSNHKLNQLVLLPRHFPAVNVEKHRNGNKDT